MRGYDLHYRRNALARYFVPFVPSVLDSTKDRTYAGITGGFGGDRRVEYIIPLEARKKGTHSFVAEATCNGMFGVPWNGDTIQPPDVRSFIFSTPHETLTAFQPNRYFQLASADLVVPNMTAWGLLWDFTTLRELIETLPGNSTLQNKALTVANAIMNTFYNNDPESIPAARKLADEVFGENWEEHGVDIYKYGPEESQVWGIGHCHIDTAWYVPRVLIPRIRYA